MKNIKYFKIKIIKFNIICVHSLDCQMTDKQLNKFTLYLSKILETCKQIIWKKKDETIKQTEKVTEAIWHLW